MTSAPDVRLYHSNGLDLLASMLHMHEYRVHLPGVGGAIGLNVLRRTQRQRRFKVSRMRMWRPDSCASFKRRLCAASRSPRVRMPSKPCGA